MAFAVSTVVGVGGLLLGGAGLAYNVYNNEKASESKAQAAQAQAEIAQLQAANVDVQRQQLALTTQQQQLQIQTQKDVITQQAQADAIRQQAAELDARRRNRDAIRQGNIAASTSLVRATNQGAAQPGSTVLQASQGNIANEVDRNITGVSQNLDAGRRLYDINKNITQIYLNAQDVNSHYVDQSAALQTQVLNTQQKIYALGGQASSSYASAAQYEGNAAIGAGLTSFGNSLSSNYPTINRLTQYFSSTASFLSTPGVTGSGVFGIGGNQ